MYVSLHNHTSASIFDSITNINDLVLRAKGLGMPALGISNHGTTTDLVSFYKCCNEHGVKPILGVEGYYTSNLNIKDRDLTFHICLYAMDINGYRNINKIVTESYQNQYYVPRIDFSMLEKYNEGIICTTACLGGILNSEDIGKICELFGDRMYGEIHANTIPEQMDHNLRVLSMFDLNHIIVATDSHYVKESEADLHRQWKGLKETDKYFTTNDYFLMTKEEIISRLHYIDKDVLWACFVNSKKIADICNVEIPMGGMHYPSIKVDNNLEEVKRVCRVGWKNKVVNRNIKDTKKYLDRLLMEFEVLEKANYLDYFLLTDNILKYCDERGIRRGIGRGSVGGSLVAYLMDITRIDPVEHNLAFERFCHLERVSPPDVDTDVQRSRRQEVVDMIKDRFGHDKVFNVRTCNYLAEASSVKRAGQILGIPHTEVNAITKSMNGIDSIENIELRELSKKLLGIVASYGTHASAILVFPSDPSEWCAIESNGEEGMVVAIDDFHHLEEQGLLKLDILGLATLDIIDNVVKHANIKEDLDCLELANEKTIKMLNNGDTLGVFQIESHVMTNIVKEMNVKTATDLFHVVALGRPGPLDSGMVKEFLARRSGLKKVTYLHPKLEPILKSTAGIIVYQEQIMEIVQALCGYTLGQADVLRRVIGRKEVERVEGAMNQIIKGATDNGIDISIASEIANQIRTFALYGFNLAHSAAYGYCAYQIAYLKAHYPEHFWAESININKELKKEEKILGFISYMRQNKIPFSPIGYTSDYFTSVRDNKIILGYHLIKGVGQKRFDIKTDSFIEFMENNPKANKGSVSAMIKAGVWSGCRTLMLQQLEWFKDTRKCRGDIPTEVVEESVFDLGTMELEVMSYCPHEVLWDYDLTSCNGYDIIGGQVVKVDFRKTKKKSQMAFVKIRDFENIVDCVLFDEDLLKEIKKGDVRLFRVDQRGQIKDSTLARRL